MTDPTDLTEFLLARIAEDEAAAIKDARWRWGQNNTACRGVLFHADGVRVEWARVVDATTITESVEELSYEEYDERALPLVARPLAECEAKRRIVELHQPHQPADLYTGCRTCLSDHTGIRDEWEPDDWPCDTLRALAQPYADHPDCREEWRDR